MLRAPMEAPSSTVAWFPIRAPSPTVQLCTRHMCATVAPSPISTGIPGSLCSTDPSWMLAPARMMIGA
ncbi:Uncharacterised protein [Mycobacteroides abscessus subsp. abscessus]|nr:Uncharacterised protein [Mycobacteroides abscessus subsp. abscessus]